MDILSRPVLPADRRIHYGPDPSQFGDLWLPSSPNHDPNTHSNRPAPLVIFFHGGWWKSAYDLGYAGALCAALKREGIATWSVEYRRIGITGGGWPATFQDATAGFDFAAQLIGPYALDPGRVIAMGHSAGGHLAFWIAGRPHVPPHSEIAAPAPRLTPRAVISLAGAIDLRLTIALSGDGLFAHDREEVYQLMGGTPDQLPDRYRAGNPGDLLPFQAPQYLLQGIDDDQIPPELPGRWVALSRGVGSQATVRFLPAADHFDVVDPESSAWPAVLAYIKLALAQ